MEITPSRVVVIETPEGYRIAKKQVDLKLTLIILDNSLPKRGQHVNTAHREWIRTDVPDLPS